MSVGELAGLAGVERKTIYRIEAGEADPTMRTIRKVSAALGVSPAELIGADE